MKVLLTFTGFHDPYAASAATGEMRSGPVLTVVAERAFDRVYLFFTPRAAEISEQTAEAIRERHPAAKVAVLDVPLKDPTNYLGILRQLRAHFRKLNTAHPEAEYFAKFLHHLGPRSARPLVIVNCGSIPENLVESQLFGHRKGSFTGATADHEGKFKSADRGVLFLDEIGELPLPAQAKLLRVLDQGEIEPVGASRPVKVNVRVIAATHRNLREMVVAGTFREDLYQRFGSSIAIPPLRSRKTDIPLLASHMLTAWNARHQRQKRLSPRAVSELVRYPWPGNVRELHRVIQQSAMLAPGKTIQPDDLRFEQPLRTNPLAVLPDPCEGFQLIPFLDDVKQRMIHRAMELSGDVQARAAKLLGISPQALNQFFKSKNAQ